MRSKKFMVIGMIIALAVIAWVLFVVFGSYQESNLPQDTGYNASSDGQNTYRKCFLNSYNEIVYQWFTCSPFDCAETYYDKTGAIVATYDSTQLSSDERTAFLAKISNCIDIDQKEFNSIVK